MHLALTRTSYVVHVGLSKALEFEKPRASINDRYSNQVFEDWRLYINTFVVVVFFKALKHKVKQLVDNLSSWDWFNCTFSNKSSAEVVEIHKGFLCAPILQIDQTRPSPYTFTLLLLRYLNLLNLWFSFTLSVKLALKLLHSQGSQGFWLHLILGIMLVCTDFAWLISSQRSWQFSCTCSC